MARLLKRGWRDDLGGLAGAARRSLLIAAPYIKEDAAEWVCGRLGPGVDVITLADIKRDSLASASLDIAALLRLGAASPASRVIALPSLHAKVYVADETAAIVTSANLTRSGIDRNLEYGVLLDDPALVRAVRDDMLEYARLGSEAPTDTIADLAPVEAELRAVRATLDANPSSGAQRRFDEAMRRARKPIAALPVGERSGNAMFSEAVLTALEHGPLPTTAIHEHVRALLPDLCDDSRELVINGTHYGKYWKSRVRNAQVTLRKRGDAERDPATRTWRRTTG